MERKVQTIRLLLKKADDLKQDAFLALFDFRNSPVSGMERSPVELLMVDFFKVFFCTNDGKDFSHLQRTKFTG